jgi:3-oxoacyl-(acyl-carrier-protein) synthase/3-hydroxymyristoyl/3-hydroxydecanoyl-(acyl carrier protein) dehydratase
MAFQPIAVLGAGCVLPGASSRDELWKLVREGRSALAPAPPGLWGVSPRADRAALAREIASDVGGYVTGFERIFDPEGFCIPVDPTLDPVFLWTLHAAREALRDAGRDVARASTRGAFILGNLSYPTPGLVKYALDVWGKKAPSVDPRNRFMSGLPAALSARAIGFEGPAFALDAACASSLYAIKLACDRLSDGSVDLAVAGGVNHADDLFLHLGFTSLAALSPTGQSRPFHRDADGLVPAQGAAVVLLKRLSDAVADGDTILGVIRGVGLSNDGRSPGLLVPSEAGQVRAMRAAYASAGIAPETVSLVECHATGTAVGDGAEVRSLGEIFAGCRDVPIGSLKSNLGHLITAAGAAALLKVLSAMRAEERPPTLHVDSQLDALSSGPLRVLRAAEPWENSGPRRAAVSAFGFGGNNAHLVVEAWTPSSSGFVMTARRPFDDEGRAGARPQVPKRDADVAVIAMEMRVGRAAATELVDAALATSASLADAGEARAADFDLDLIGMRIPPADLLAALPQQTWLLDAVTSLAGGGGVIDRLPKERTAILVGMQCDAEVARCGLRFRREGAVSGPRTDTALAAAVTVGCMPNMVANRVGHHLGLEAPSFTVSAEEASGTVALDLAVRALRASEVDAAIVAAVDLSCEPVQRAAARSVLPAHRGAPGDACVVLVIKRLADARRDGDRVLALLGGSTSASSLGLDDRSSGLSPSLGHSHAASGLLHVAAAVAACRRGAGETVVRVVATGGTETAIGVRAGDDGMDAEAKRPAIGPSSRRLHIPAHLEEVQLPANEALAQVMVPPPRLPSVRRGPVQELTLSVAARSAIEPPVLRTRGDPRFARASALAAHHHALSELHTSFLRRQTDLHARFLETLFAPLAARSLQPSPSALPPAIEVTSAPERPGPKLGRRDLEALASGPISAVFGPRFRAQDDFRRVVRMPEPPLLLADRVLGIAGEPGSMGLGTIWTETDVTADAWYLHEGRMPSGILIEAGQADLLLISWLGVDAHNRGERVYRLLGCDLTSHGPLPGPGDTLTYEIHVDGHATQGDVRLFFFHYDCRVNGELRVSVRGGQAGFFTDEELRNSAGVLFRAEESTPTPNPRLDPPPRVSEKRHFTDEELDHLVSGRARACFGPGFERADTHTRTPTIQGGRMRLLDEVTDFDPTGGPWKRGYLRARLALSPDQWFFAGHFKDDPCMPGTLMFEGAVQAMSVYLAALGFTLARDGFRFEPVPEHVYRLRCRGQATPVSRELVYELFVDEIADGPTPTLFADLLGTVDGLPAFHCRRMGLRLVPAYPMDAGRLAVELPAGEPPVAKSGDFAFDQRSLLACAWGRPSEAFGPMYERFDAGVRVPRLPGPPYHVMSRVTSVTGAMGGMEKASAVVAEYDVPEDAWYFADNGAPVMPFAVLLEVALQPCGWLASYAGCATSVGREVVFRNLDGTGRVEREVGRDAGTLSTSARLTSISSVGALLIVGFDVRVSSGAGTVFTCETVFGFFPPETMREQPGLPDTGALPALPPPSPLQTPTAPRLAGGRLAMLGDAAIDPAGGKAGLGRIVATRAVDASDWFFRAHFMGDPVQPGSLGLEAMVQALEALALARGLGDGLADTRFEALAPGVPLTWKYRGQVLPEDHETTVEVEITEVRPSPAGTLVIGEGSFRVGGKRIYHAAGVSTRIVGRPARYRGSWGQHGHWHIASDIPSLEPPAKLHRTIPILWMRSQIGVQGPLDASSLATAIRETFDRHDILRSIVKDAGDGPPMVELLPGWLPEAPIVDTSHLPPEARAASRAQFFVEQLDPSSGPPARVAIFRDGPLDHDVCLSQHHLFSDGMSIIRFWDEVLERYRARALGRAPALPRKGPSFERYCRAVDDYLASDASAADRAYWEEALRGAVPLVLPYDKQRTEAPDFLGDRVPIAVEPLLRRRLEEILKREKAGIFSALLWALGEALHAVTGQEDLLFRTIHANRVLPGFPDAFDVMGPIFSNVPLRLVLRPGAPARARLSDAQRVVEGAMAHGAVHFDFMRSVMRLPLSVPRASLLYQAFVPPASRDIGPLTVRTSEPVGIARGHSLRDLYLVLWHDGEALRGVAMFATQVFEKPTIERLVERFLRALETLVATP